MTYIYIYVAQSYYTVAVVELLLVQKPKCKLFSNKIQVIPVFFAKKKLILHDKSVLNSC